MSLLLIEACGGLQVREPPARPSGSQWSGQNREEAVTEAGVSRLLGEARGRSRTTGSAGSLSPARPVHSGIAERGLSDRFEARLLPELGPNLGPWAIPTCSDPVGPVSQAPLPTGFLSGLARGAPAGTWGPGYPCPLSCGASPLRSQPWILEAAASWRPCSQSAVTPWHLALSYSSSSGACSAPSPLRGAT